MVKNGCGLSGHETLKLTVSQNKSIEWTGFLHAGANSEKSKVISMIFGWAWSKISVAI